MIGLINGKRRVLSCISGCYHVEAGVMHHRREGRENLRLDPRTPPPSYCRPVRWLFVDKISKFEY